MTKPFNSQQTKPRILDAAEILFAEHGFAATSLRDITKEAAVNLAAVNYHFGSKTALLSAVFERRINPINEERLRLLTELEKSASGKPLDLHDVLRAFLLPPFLKMQEWGESGRKFMQLVGRTHSVEASEQMHEAFFKHFEEIIVRFTRAFENILPELPKQNLHLRMQFVVGAMAHTLVWSQKLEQLSQADPNHPISTFEELLQFVAAGMAAKHPPHTTKGIR